ncbi:YgfZ/GcvT domain-containing protein [Chromobacterium sp. CV08]|uniref:CAF17-like 4Fe-4S cluster assembly/insertion protein YgfZ n=1 Tax=Chromobacterium sp. CV08 TaxID=3133274 RepID=UPI003DA9B897
MDAFWNEWLRQKGVARDGEGKLPTAQHLQQVQALQNGSVLAPLDNYALIRVDGDDAETFLQGQLSSDIRDVKDGRAQYSTYSTAKGRMLASFLIWRQQGAYYLMVSADVAQAIAKRLAMFVLRSKVKVSLVEGSALLGLSGPFAETILQGHFPGVASWDPLQQQTSGDASLVKLRNGVYLLAGTGALPCDIAAAPDWQAATPEVWALHDIEAGVAWVTSATQEQFVPQMANMELIGAVSFKKGCYPGQEIVARSQYLGKMKRRMFKVQFGQPLVAGCKLYSPQLPEQSVGMLAAVCQVDKERYLGLAVVQSQTWSDGVFADEGHTIALQALELPYPLESVTE